MEMHCGVAERSILPSDAPYDEVENPAPVVCQHQEHIQDLKPDGRHGEEVDRDQAF